MSNPFFTVNAADNVVVSVGLNTTGQYIVAVTQSGTVYTSSNYGASFTQTGTDINSDYIPGCQRIVSSSNGQYFVIASNDNVFTSIDYGVTWTQQLPILIITSVVSNASGNLLIGCYPGFIYNSTDHGLSWSQTTPTNEQMFAINGTSTDYLVGVSNADNSIWTSSNQGTTWVQKNNTNSFTNAAISADGQIIYALHGNQPSSSLQISLNGGTTWTTLSSITGWCYNVCCSSDGSTAVISGAFANGPDALGIYWTNDLGATWTSEIYTSTTRDNWCYTNVSGDGLCGAAGDFDQNYIFTFALTASPPVPPSPGNICFPKGTPIETDQGTFAIDMIAAILGHGNTTLTIRNKPIVAISQTLSTDKTLVCFEQDALGLNKPNKMTMVSREHKIGYKGHLIKAKYFVEYLPKDRVHLVPHCPSDILYNVLLDNYSIMKVNNLSVETLHPQNPVAISIINSKKPKIKQKKRSFAKMTLV